MTETAGMRALLDLEDAAPDVLREFVPGTDIPLWPLARWPVSRALAETDIGTSVPTYAQPGLRRRVMTTARALLPNPRSSRHAPIARHLFIVSGWTKVPGPRGFHNWLSDDFAAALGDQAIVVQDAHLDALSRGQQVPAHPRTYSASGENTRASRAAQRNPLSAGDRAHLEQTLLTAFAELEHPVTDAGRTRAIADVIGRAERAPHAQRAFARLVDRVQPARIYMQTAAYGTRAAEISLARSRGIEVAELQHGWMGSSHAAYNFGQVMREPDLERCLPDTILGYGDFWGRDIRFPGRFVTVGKPTLDPDTLRTRPWNERDRRVLFVSSNYAFETVDAALHALRDALPSDWTVALRPHPVERAAASSRHADALARDGVELDLGMDAAAALASSRAVVGFSSTMLFEALAYGSHVAVVDSPLGDHYAAADIFPLRIRGDLADAATVAKRFLTAPDAVDRRIAESVWHGGAIDAFLSFARS